MADEQKVLLHDIEELLDSDDRTALTTLLTEQRSSDIAEVVEVVDDSEKRVLFDLMDRPISAEVLEKVDEATRSKLFDLLGEELITSLISELDPDDAADVLAEMDEDESEEVLEHLSIDEAKQIKDLMQYSEDSAGGIMDPVVISVQEDANVGQAVNEIRKAEIDEDFFSIFVVNSQGQFLGDVRLRHLISKHENTLIKQLIDTDTIYVRVDTDQEEVRNIFSKNDLIVVPVLDEDSRLVGRITADRVIEVAEEEAAEDVYAMAGTDAAELENISILHASRVRMTWLLPCLCGTAVTAILYIVFRGIFDGHNQLGIYLVAMAFAPMIAAISGNAGLQTSAIVVCGLATGDLAALKIGQVFAREVRIAILVAICCGIAGGLICASIPGIIGTEALIGNDAGQLEQTNPDADTAEDQAGKKITTAQHLRIVLSFTISMFSAIMVATTLGLLLPFAFRNVGIDPAISSGPLVTTANDSIGVAIYLSMTMLLT